MYQETKEESKPRLAVEPSHSAPGGGSRTKNGYFDGGSSGYSGGGGGGYSHAGGGGGHLLREIKDLLPKLSALPGVMGSVAIQYDGTPIADNLARHPDLGILSIDAAHTYATTYDSIKKFGHRELYQLAFKSEHGFVYIADFSNGLLITVLNVQDLQKLIALLKTVRLLIGAPPN